MSSAAPHELRFLAPGDDWYAGSADRYEVTIRLRGGGSDRRRCSRCPPGATETIALPQRARNVRVVAFDDAGNRGPALRLRVGRLAPVDGSVRGPGVALRREG